ncbi:hypothetical protein HWI79_599 [Cryptosporidium felis]|nr:hypothetical protein HWI79_599 [Cryptosporidium felis]
MNKFEDGLEYLKKRISRLEEEISDSLDVIKRLEEGKNVLEKDLQDFESLEQTLNELYNVIYGVSVFHEANHQLLKIFLNEKLKKINKKFYLDKLQYLEDSTFTNYEEILNNYSISRSSLTEDLKQKMEFKGIVDFNILLSSLAKFKNSSEEAYNQIMSTSNLFKISLNYIYLDIITWDPFMDSSSKRIDFIHFSKVEEFLRDQLMDLSNNEEILTDFIEKVSSEFLSEYFSEIINEYWSPFYFEETENLLSSVNYIRERFNLELKNIQEGIFERLRDSYFKFIIELSKKPNKEIKFALLLLNWSTSILLFGRKLQVRKEVIDLLLNETISNHKQNFNSDNISRETKEILYFIEFDLDENLEPERNLEGKSKEYLKYIYLTTSKIITTYNLNHSKKKYALIEIVSNIILK